MKRFILIFVAFLLTLPLFAQEKSPPLKDQKDKVSYSIGLSIAANFSRQNVEINPEALAAGVKDGMAGKPLTQDQIKEVSHSSGLSIGSNFAKENIEINPEAFTAGIRDGIAQKPQLTQDQIKEVMTAFQKDMQAKQKAAGEKHAAEGAKFLEENKKKEGVKTTASGLQYKVIKEGTGPQPKATDMVTANYRGTLIDGTEFDSSYKRGQPSKFALNGVIKGWTEALQLMKVGSKYQLFVPSDLAYGERVPPGSSIPFNSTLIFEVELMDVQPGPTPAAAPPSGAPPPPGAAPQGTMPPPPSRPSPSPKASPKASPK